MNFETIKENMIQNKSVITDVCIAMAGDYVYHGEPLTLDSTVFSNLIENFNRESQALPVFRGHADVNGSSTGEEVDSYGWILGLTMDEDSNLWAKVEFNKEMADSIKDGRFKYCSIYMREESDRQTGDEIGNRLVSLAMTNEPYLPNLPAITLSNKKNNFKEYIYSKEILTMKKSIKKILSATSTEMAETLPEAKKAEEQVDKMQTGKTVDTTIDEFDPVAALEEIKPEEMSMEDFVKSLIELVKAEAKEPEVESKEEEASPAEEKDSTVMASDEDDSSKEEDSEDEEESSDKKEVAASNNLARKMNVALSAANKKIKELEKEVASHREEVVLSVVNQAVKQGKLFDAEKSLFVELGKSNKKLFDEMIKARGINPAIVLGRISGTNKDENKFSALDRQLTEHEKKILAGAKIKV